VGRTTFDCPFSLRRVTAAFLAPPGADTPSDVLSCSVFDDPRGIRCKKGCLTLAHSRWKPSPVVPRYSLIAGGVAVRQAA